MALSLITSIPATCYTSQLQEISLSTSAASVTLTITHQAVLYYSGNGQTRVFQATYSTRSNRAKMYDIGSLLETFMLNRDGVQQFYFTFTDGTDTLEETYAVIYCKQQPVRSAADLASSSYITNYLTRLVYLGANDQLPYFAGFGSPGGYTVRTITYSVVYRNPDGTLGTYSMIAGGRAGYGVSYVISSPDVIREMFAPVIPQGAEVTYSSSNPAVASVFTLSGDVTLVAAGTTTITATFIGDEAYNATSASCILTVESSGVITDIENIEIPDRTSSVTSAVKIIDRQTGTLYIICPDGAIYNATGVRVK